MSLKLALCICLFLYPLIGDALGTNPADEENAPPDSSIKRLIHSLAKETVDTSKVKILNEIAWHYYPSQSDKAIVFADSALRIAEKIGWQKGQAEAMLNIGEVYRYKGDIKISLENYQNALTVFQQINDITGIANSLTGIGTSYFHISEYLKALDYLNRASKIFKEINDKKGTAKTYTHMGIVYGTIKEYKKSIEYFNNALKIFEGCNDSLSIGILLGDLGMAYSELKDYNKALSLYLKAIKIFNSTGDLYNYSIFLGNMGLIYTELGDYSRAQNHFEKSLKFAKELKDEYGIAYQYGNLGKLKLKIAAEKKQINTSFKRKKEINESISFLTRTVDLFKTLGEKDEQKNFLFLLSDAYKLNNDYRNALDAYYSARVLQDSIFSSDNTKMIAGLEIQKELELKEKEIRFLNEENNYQTVYGKAAVTLAIIVVIISILIIYFYTKKRKDNLLLRENIRMREETEESLRLNKIELEKHQLHLESIVIGRTKDLDKTITELNLEVIERKKAEENVQAALEEKDGLLQEKEILLKEIHHRVKNNLQVISSLLYLQSRTIKDAELLSMFDDSRNRIRSMALIHEKLYQSNGFSEINLFDYVDSLLNQLKKSFRSKELMVKNYILIDHDIKFNLDTAMACGLIINELITNAFKYAFPESWVAKQAADHEFKIEIQTIKENEHSYTLVISDNGIGIPEDFEIEKAESLGLKIVTTMVTQIGGSMEIKRDAGTKFMISFLYNK